MAIILRVNAAKTGHRILVDRSSGGIQPRRHQAWCSPYGNAKARDDA